MWGYTAIDYASSYYYSVESIAIPEPNGQPDPNYPAVSASGTPSAGVSDTIPAQGSTLYGLQTNHMILAPNGDPFGFAGITAGNYNTTFTVNPTGISGPAITTWHLIGSTYVHTDTYDSPPAITGIDSTSYANPAVPGDYPAIVLYGTDLTYWAGTPSQTTISIPGIYTNITYADSGQVNVEYAIPNGTPAGTITGTLTTPKGFTTFSFTVSSSLGFQSISFPAIGNQNIVTSPVNVNPTATSGLTVTLSSATTNVCTVSGTSVTLVATGTCTLTAQQHGNGSWQAASDVTQSFTVTSSGGGSGGSGGSYTDYIRLGSRVVAIETMAPSGGPAVTASPSQGAYSSAPFTFSYSNSAGVSGVSVLINSAINGAGACWMYFDGTSLSLAADDGSTWSGTLSNSQCSLTAPANVTNSGTYKSFTSTITFAGGFAGTKNIYMYGASGYQTAGTITVSGGSVPALTLSPTSGTGISGSFTFSASDGAGIAGLTVLINNGINGSGACWFSTDGTSVSLANDSGTAWSGSTLSNSQCNISSLTPSHTSTGVSLTGSITFNSSFAGAKTVYMYAIDNNNAQEGYDAKGAWTVP
jgi:hypothetical protein